MANNNFKKKKIQETPNGGFGQYREDTGGGKPFAKGNSNTRTTKENGKKRQEQNDTMQPRTNDGKFTYKSVNGQSIDPKYGPSRGKTVNPLLTGGENGVKIEDVEKEFASQSGSYWNKYKDSWYTKGGEMVLTAKRGKGIAVSVRVAGDSIWNVAKRMYDKVKGEFQDESTTFEETKKGRPGMEEQAAKQVAKTTGQEAPVISQSTGGIKLKPGTTFTPVPTKQAPTQAQPVQPTPVMPNAPTQQQPTQQVAPSVGSGFGNQLTHNPNEIQAIRTAIRNTGEDDSLYSDEMIDQEYDSFIQAFQPNTNNNSNANANATTDNDEEEDSDAIKKIKSMGFSE